MDSGKKNPKKWRQRVGTPAQLIERIPDNSPVRENYDSVTLVSMVYSRCDSVLNPSVDPF
jgi:hypothetical protein